MKIAKCHFGFWYSNVIPRTVRPHLSLFVNATVGYKKSRLSAYPLSSHKFSNNFKSGMSNACSLCSSLSAYGTNTPRDLHGVYAYVYVTVVVPVIQVYNIGFVLWRKAHATAWLLCPEICTFFFLFFFMTYNPNSIKSFVYLASREVEAVL